MGLTKTLLVAVLILLLGYGALEARGIVLGPSLTLASPAPYATVEGGLLTVSGHESRAVALMLDGSPVLPQENGSFATTLSLPSGGAILTLTATDRFGRSVTRTRTVYVP